ncbi:MAG: hypothetical protein R3C03_10155 [Pirellulaceae bacterium]
MAKMNKAARVRDFLTKNPDATWGSAESSLAKYGISGGYFAMTKSKWKNADSDSAPKARGRKKGSKAANSNGDLIANAAAFAKDAGSIDTAIEALEKLKMYQL